MPDFKNGTFERKIRILEKNAMEPNFKIAIEAAIDAGRKIMEIYQEKDCNIQLKQDNSPITLADQEANEIINAALLPTGTPIISEENDQVPYSERKQWTQCWIVDPLDGTKEFIQRNGEFTVNIAFVRNEKPIFGVIYAPALNLLYFAEVKEGKAFKAIYSGEKKVSFLENSEEINPIREEKIYTVVGSRSHMNEKTENYIKGVKKQYGEHIRIVQRGSSLKFCLMAEGKADVYPRFGPTMEWDTAAGQAICEAVGLRCISTETNKSMTYNRENLLNGSFIVSYER